jgi:hypothetical protein
MSKALAPPDFCNAPRVPQSGAAHDRCPLRRAVALHPGDSRGVAINQDARMNEGAARVRRPTARDR